MDTVPHIENRKFFPYPYEMFQRLKVTDKATPKKIPFKDPPKEIFIHKGGGYQMEWPTTFFNYYTNNGRIVIPREGTSS